MRAKLSIVTSVACVAACLFWPARLDATDPTLRVIVHPTRSRSLTIAEVRAIFLKQQLLWGDGQTIVAVNREAGSEARENFSRQVFGQSSRQQAAYWNRRYFEGGEFPPATLASDEAVLRFVAANANAIGYVATDAPAAVAVALVLDAAAAGER